MGRTRPRMGSVNTPATPTTRATSQHIIYHPSYDGTHPASYGGLSTHRLLLRHVRPHNISYITPHTTGRTRPRMRSVNMPATPTSCATSALGLAIFSPARTQSYLPSYVGTHPATYGVCQHAGYSYDTCDLNTISALGLATFSPAHTGYTSYKFGPDWTVGSLTIARSDGY
ncbi:unnamed protein product [Prunus brigantina]